MGFRNRKVPKPLNPQKEAELEDWYPTLCSLAGVSHFDEAASEANERLRQLGLPLLGPVAARSGLERFRSRIYLKLPKPTFFVGSLYIPY